MLEWLSHTVIYLLTLVVFLFSTQSLASLKHLLIKKNLNNSIKRIYRNRLWWLLAFPIVSFAIYFDKLPNLKMSNPWTIIITFGCQLLIAIYMDPTPKSDSKVNLEDGVELASETLEGNDSLDEIKKAKSTNTDNHLGQKRGIDLNDHTGNVDSSDISDLL